MRQRGIHQEDEVAGRSASPNDDIASHRNSVAQPPNNHAANDTQHERPVADELSPDQEHTRGADKDAAEDTSRKSVRLTTKNASFPAEAPGTSPSQPAKLHRGGGNGGRQPDGSAQVCTKKKRGATGSGSLKAAKK